MPSNKAAYLTAAGARPLAVQEAPYTSPKSGQIAIKNGAFAVNPCDVMMLELGVFIKTWPFVLGCDVAGTVEEVGPDVSYVKAGDHVLAVACETVGDPADGSMEMVGTGGAGGFQLYSVVNADRVTKLPDNVSFEEASVLPLCLLTAATGLYSSSLLDLDRPSIEAKPKSEYIIVWGGASSVGACAIQLAVNSGYRVVTTASQTNVSACKELGAEKVFDYRNEAVVDEITAYLNGKKTAGILDAVSGGFKSGTMASCVELAQKLKQTPMVVSTKPGAEKGCSENVRAGSIAVHMSGEEIKKIFQDFLAKALEAGKFKGKPTPLVVGKGLEYAQEACDTWKSGVSAKKVVVSL